MTLKLLRKLTAALVCMAMLLGLFPVAQSVNNVYASAQEAYLNNSDFESAQPVPGWTIEDSSGSIATSKTVVHGGVKALEMIDTGSLQSPLASSDCIPVVAGDKVTASLYANVAAYDGTAAYVDAIFSIWYCDANYNRIGQAYGPDIQTNGGWNQYTSPEITVPAKVGDTDVASVCIAVYGGGAAECKAYFDDVTISVNGTAATLSNSDFESAQSIAGWTVEDSSGTVALSTVVVHSGVNSLEMIDTGATQSPLVSSDVIPVAAGDKFTASAFANVASNGGAAYVDAIFSIWYCDANYNRIGQAYGPDIQTNGGWNQYTSSEIIVPAKVGEVDVAGICVAFYGAGGGECKAYFDDVTVMVDRVLYLDNNFTNPGFEKAINEDGTVTDWAMDDGATAANFKVTSGADISYVNSSPCLEMIDPDGSQSPWLYGNKIAANPGDQISVSAHVKVDQGYAELAIIFFDENGNIFDEDWNWAFYPYPCIEIGATSGWTDQTVTGIIPEGARGYRAFVWSGTSAVTTAYFDDFKMSVGIMAPEVLLESDCSNLSDMESAGWTIFEPETGNYTTDNTHSTGLGTMTADTIKSVPAGQTLFYMDSTSGAEAIGAFKKIDEINVIGSNPWKLELDMNMKDLMTSTTPDAVSGFSVVVDIGQSEKVYRVNFGGDGKIRALTETGFVEQAANLYIGDGLVHHWALEGDSTGRLEISCDGSYVTSFTGVHVAGSWNKEYGVAFVDYNSGISAGNNEVYFDNIKLTVYGDTAPNPGTGIIAGEPVDLGAAVMGGKPLFLYSIIEKNPVTNNDELYTVSTGSTDSSSIFYAIDPTTGDMLFNEQIPGTVHNYGIVKGSDNKIYFAGCDTGKLYRYTPGANGQGIVEDLGANPCDTWVWDIAASDDGKIYGATSQTDGGAEGAKVFEYDIATATFKDLGVIKAGCTYARGLGVDGDNLYVGVGIPDALIQINRADPTQKTEITIPAFGDIPGTGADGRMCGHVWSYNNKLFVRNNAMKLFVLDATTHELLNVLSFQQAISSPSPYNSNIIYYKSKNAVWQYDCSTNVAQQVENSPTLSGDASNALDWFTPTTGANAGKTLLGITDDAGGFVIYDPQANTAVDGILTMQPQAVDIQSIEKGPDGKLYIGGYQFGASVFDPMTQKVIYNAPRLDQPEGIGFLNGKVYFGTYGSARIYSYDPTKPFNYTYEAGGNPGLAYDIGNDQDRPFALTSGDNKLFVGTVPDYGMLGGALTIYDEILDTWTEYRNVVQNQSITGLAYKDGLVYGGTSVAGGIGINSTAPEAKIFVWDVATGTKVKEATISIPGLKSTYEKTERIRPVMIGSLTFGEDGLLWGAADGALFALNPDTLEVVKYKVLASMNYDQDSAWRPYYLRWGTDGLLYTTIGRKVTVFNTETMGYDTLTGYAGLATIGNDGNIYYANGSRLMMVALTRPGDITPFPTVTPTPVPTATPTATPTPSPIPEFNDVEGNWAHKAIMTLVKEGILNGYDDGTVKPNANATRAEFVNMIMKMMKEEAKSTASFNDISSSAWYMKALSLAVEKGWINGRPDGSFGPNDSITREEAMVIISKIIDSLGVKPADNLSAIDAYKDNASISKWARADVAKLIGLGIIKGSGNKINPEAEITRAEISTILVRIMEDYLNK